MVKHALFKKAHEALEQGKVDLSMPSPNLVFLKGHMNNRPHGITGRFDPLDKDSKGKDMWLEIQRRVNILTLKHNQIARPRFKVQKMLQQCQSSSASPPLQSGQDAGSLDLNTAAGKH